jgi:hypothetical protein
MTKYHENNRVHVEGWKNNDAYKIAKKVVMPHYLADAEEYYKTFRPNIHRWQEFQDLELVAAYLSGDNIDNIPNQDLLKSCIEGTPIDQGGKWRESRYFRFKCFKKGTIHIEFKDDMIRDHINMTVAANRQWLPPKEESEWRKRKNNGKAGPKPKPTKKPKVKPEPIKELPSAKHKEVITSETNPSQTLLFSL